MYGLTVMLSVPTRMISKNIEKIILHINSIISEYLCKYHVEQVQVDMNAPSEIF